MRDFFSMPLDLWFRHRKKVLLASNDRYENMLVGQSLAKQIEASSCNLSWMLRSTGWACPLGYCWPRRLRSFETSVLSWHRRYSDVLQHWFARLVRKHTREVDTRGEALLSECSHHSCGQQKGKKVQIDHKNILSFIFLQYYDTRNYFNTHRFSAFFPTKSKAFDWTTKKHDSLNFNSL